MNEMRREKTACAVDMMNSRRWALDFYSELLFLCPSLLSDLPTCINIQQTSINGGACTPPLVRMKLLMARN